MAGCVQITSRRQTAAAHQTAATIPANVTWVCFSAGVGLTLTDMTSGPQECVCCVSVWHRRSDLSITHTQRHTPPDSWDLKEQFNFLYAHWSISFFFLRTKIQFLRRERGGWMWFQLDYNISHAKNECFKMKVFACKVLQKFSQPLNQNEITFSR